MSEDRQEETRELTLRPTVALPIPVEQAVAEWEAYQELTRRLLDDSDYQQNGRERFKKKSAWRKYAKAFNLTDRVVYEHIERAPDGWPIWARLRVEASASNGRTSEADHECHTTERCCPAAQGAACRKKSWSNHTCCQPGCNGRIHWSHPGDVAATALTRAKNRAISDLIGAGEVSAEEMDGQRHADAEGSDSLRPTSAHQSQATPAASEPRRAGRAPLTNGDAARANGKTTDAQRSAIASMLDRLGRTQEIPAEFEAAAELIRKLNDDLDADKGNVIEGEAREIPAEPPAESKGAAPASADDEGASEILCAACGQALTETRFKDGTVWTPAQLATYARKKHGKPLCMPDYKAANDALKLTQTPALTQ